MPRKIVVGKGLNSQEIIGSNSNVTMRMAKMKELKNGMELLKEMRVVVGELVNAAEVKNLMKSFPVFTSFEKGITKIDIIDLLDDDDKKKIMTSTIETANLVPAGSIVLLTMPLTSVVLRKTSVPQQFMDAVFHLNNRHSRTRMMATATTT